MDLSVDLISQFAKLTKEKEKPKSETTVYGVTVEYEGRMYVKFDGSDLLTPVLTTTDMVAGERVSVLLKNHTATVTGNLSSPSARTDDMKAVGTAVSELGSKISEFEIIISDKVTTKDLDAINGRIDTLVSDNVTVKQTLSAAEASIETLEADVESVNESLTASNADIENLKSNKLDVTVANAKYATIESLTATNADLNNLESTYAAFEVATANRLSVTEGDISKLKTDKLDAATANITYAKIADLNSTNADISNLEAEVADLDTLIFGSATGSTIHSSFANAVVAQLSNAQIKSAMIENVSASKITSGDIITNDVRVMSEDGSLIISDETIQIKDGTRVRVQIGKDSSNNYSINIWDADGNLMFSEGGITDNAIKTAIIRNDMVSDTANIAAHKLDIDSLFEEINGSTKTIKSSKIYLDDKKQTLNVAFESMSTDLTELQNGVSSQGTQISAIQGQISSKVWQQDINTAVSEVNETTDNLSTQYEELTQEVSGLSATVSNHTSALTKKADSTTVTEVNNKVISLESNLSGFKSTVSSTYATKTALTATDTKAANAQTAASNAQSSIDNLEIGGRNLLLDSAKELTSTREYVGVDITPIAMKYAGTGQKLSVSADVSATTDGLMKMYSLGKYMIYNPSQITANVVTGEFTRMKMEGINIEYLPDGQNGEVCTLSFYGNYDTGIIPIVKNIKVEIGNRCTDWTPAPEDVDADILAVQENVNETQADIEALTTRVSSAETTISNNTTAINLRATKTEVATAKSEAISTASTDATTKANNALNSANANTTNLLKSYSTTEQMNAAIQVKADSITSSVSSTYATKTALETTNSNVTKANTAATNAQTTANKAQTSASNAQTAADNAQSSADAAQSDIDNLSIGGRNLYLNSELEKSTTRFLSLVTYDIFADYIGEEVTISFDAIILEGGTSRELQMYGYQSNGISIGEVFKFTPTTEWTRFAFTTPIKDWGIINETYTPGAIGFYDWAGDNSFALRRIKMELGNRATDWTPAPEDMATVDDVESVQSSVTLTEQRLTTAETLIEQLTDSISMLVTDGNGQSLMTQTSDGWTFSTAELQDIVDTTSKNLDELTNNVGDIDSTVGILQQAVDDLGIIGDYVKITTYEDEPCIELGESDSDFKLMITNTRIMFMEGTGVPAYINNQSLFINKAVIEEELQQGEFVWRSRSNGNLGLIWKGANS